MEEHKEKNYPPREERRSPGRPDRDAVIIRTSLVGIAVNVLLAAIKAIVGLGARSIAVVTDAVNNLSDALSGVVTILGAKLSGKMPDKKHPLGYGRVEYLSTTVVAALVLYAGITALTESVKKMFAPQGAEYSLLSLALIALAVGAKLLLGRYVKKKGEATDSASLRASGTDALSDAGLSASVLLCAALRMLTGVSLEAYLGAVIALFIIRSGIGMIRETVSEILGQRTDAELSREVKELVYREPGVSGAYDLLLSNYGPDRYYGSVNIEVADTVSAGEIDSMTRRIRGRVYWKTGVTLSSVGVYSRNTRDAEALRLREEIETRLKARGDVVEVYGFYSPDDSREVHFYVVFTFGTDCPAELAKIGEELKAAYPDRSFRIAPHIDVSD